MYAVLSPLRLSVNSLVFTIGFVGSFVAECVSLHSTGMKAQVREFLEWSKFK